VEKTSQKESAVNMTKQFAIFLLRVGNRSAQRGAAAMRIFQLIALFALSQQ